MPIDTRIALGVTGLDPNGFINALAAGQKQRELNNASDRLARKDELADTTRNELSAYLSGDRSEEAKRRLAATSPESVLAIEKTAATAGLSAAKTATAAAQTKKAELEGKLKEVELGSMILGTATDEPSYQAGLVQAREAGLDVSQAPARYFPDWVAQRRQQGLKAKDQIQLQLQTLNVESQIGISQGHLDVAQAGLGERQRHNKVQESKKPGGGLSITGYDDKGRPLIQVGGAAPLGKPAVNTLEEKQIQGIEALSRLDEIERVSDPKLLTYGNTLKDKALGVKSNLGLELTPDQKAFHNQATDMRQSTMENLSRTIKDLTGSAMQLSEVPRIEATVPSMSDDPDQFPRKLKNATRLIRNGVIRAQIAREQGMDPLNTGIDLGDTKTLIDKRGEQLTRHYAARAPGMAPADVEAAIDKQLKAEFGL